MFESNHLVKIGVIVVLYQPDDEQLNNLGQFDACECCIVDNSHEPLNLSDRLSRNYSYIWNGNKGGIAGAFNRGIECLLDKQCDYVFTFDQDSKLPDGFFEKTIQYINNSPCKVDVVCPDFFDINSKTNATFVLLTKFNYLISKSGITDFAISSGMCISNACLRDIGVFNEKFIIDHVDTAFCLKAKEANYLIHVNYAVCLNHSIGQRETHKFLGVTLKPNHHNALRKYYIARNGTYLAFCYIKKYPGYFILNLFRLAHEFICTVLYEKQKINKIVMMSKGVWHAMTSRLGPV